MENENNKRLKQTEGLKELAKLFFKLGSIAFGGPAAHIAMMENEVVTNKKWMSREHFLDLVGATNLIPGPNSTEMTMHCGYEKAGWKGLVVAGISFILPAVVITSVLAWLYRQYGHLPKVEPFIYGIKPAVIAVIIFAVCRLGKKAIKNIQLGILGTVTLVACLLGVHEIIALFGCGVGGLLLHFTRKWHTNTHLFPVFFFQAAMPGAEIGSLKIFWIFLKVGAILYGSGYVLFALLDAELVGSGLLTRPELIDAVAAGQFTPGPVLTTATFIGWQLGGAWGALAATAGIFLPSFLFVIILNPVIPRLRKSDIMAVFLDAVNIGAVAVIAAVCVDMGKDALIDWRTLFIAIVSLVMVFTFRKINNALIVAGGAALGYVLTFL